VMAKSRANATTTDDGKPIGPFVIDDGHRE
jgi:hypothetical protein